MQYNNQLIREGETIMALDIRPIPIVTGADADRFVEAAAAAERHPHKCNVQLSQGDFDKIMAKAKLD